MLNLFLQITMYLTYFWVTISLLVLCVDALDWSYSDQTIWPSISPSCSGTEQSPIDIQRAKIRINESLAIEMLNYDRPHAGYSVVNNGHSIQFNYIGDKSTAPTITGTALNGDKYLLAQLHSHWGSRKGEGSEHTIDGLAYSLETHLVHYNSRYNSLTEALGKSDGVTVLAIFYQIDRESNHKLDDVLITVHNVGVFSDPKEINYGLRLNDLLPNNLNNFYRYPGSLTTPPCTERVNWLVLDTPASIGLEQIEIYRVAKNERERTVISNNFRSIQNKRARVVEASWDALHGSAVSPSISAALGVFVAISLAVFRF